MSNSDWFQWYLITIGGIEDWPKSFVLKLGLFRLKFGLNFGFWLILQHWLIQYVWCFRFWFLSMIFDYHWCYLRVAQPGSTFLAQNYGFLGPNLFQNLVSSLYIDIKTYNSYFFQPLSMLFVSRICNISPIPISTYYCSISVGPSQISLVHFYLTSHFYLQIHF